MYLLFQYHGHKYKYLMEIMNKITTNIVNLLNYFSVDWNTTEN